MTWSLALEPTDNIHAGENSEQLLAGTTLAGRSGFTISEGDVFGQGLESAMKGREKSIPGREDDRCKGLEARACLVCLRIKKASMARVD